MTPVSSCHSVLTDDSRYFQINNDLPLSLRFCYIYMVLHMVGCLGGGWLITFRSPEIASVTLPTHFVPGIHYLHVISQFKGSDSLAWSCDTSLLVVVLITRCHNSTQRCLTPQTSNQHVKYWMPHRFLLTTCLLFDNHFN